MSTIKSNNHQVGQSATATNNFTWYQPASPDGTVRLGKGNSGATTSDVITVDGSGNLTITGNLTTGGTIPSERIVQGTAQATTSGTAVGFTGLPSWVKKITLMIKGSTTVLNALRGIQIGSGSYVATGYAGSISTITGSGTTSSSTNSTQFNISNSNNAATSGIATLCLLDSSTNTWMYTSITAQDGSTYNTSYASGFISLSGSLDRIQLIISGTTFSAGTVNIIYEG